MAFQRRGMTGQWTIRYYAELNRPDERLADHEIEARFSDLVSTLLDVVLCSC